MSAGVQELQEFRSCGISEESGTLNACLLNHLVSARTDPPFDSVDSSVTKRLIRIAVE
jgi:hypothetical protein